MRVILAKPPKLEPPTSWTKIRRFAARSGWRKAASMTSRFVFGSERFYLVFASGFVQGSNIVKYSALSRGVCVDFRLYVVFQNIPSVSRTAIPNNSRFQHQPHCWECWRPLALDEAFASVEGGGAVSRQNQPLSNLLHHPSLWAQLWGQGGRGPSLFSRLRPTQHVAIRASLSKATWQENLFFQRIELITIQVDPKSSRVLCQLDVLP